MANGPLYGFPWQQPANRHPNFASPYINGADATKDAIICSDFSLKIKDEMNIPITIPIPAPSPENPAPILPPFMVTVTEIDITIVHMKVRR